ncbi:MAG: restriction endonuclease [Candidatus Nanopusillus acidilobi]|jgi:restriction system protein
MSEINLPKFDEFLAPILKYANDDKEHTLSETIEAMSNQFNLSEEDRNLLMPNGKRTYIYNRIAWAISYLAQAGLLVRTGRSKYKISDIGKEEVKIIPEKISYKYLEKFESFQKFIESQRPKKRDITDQKILHNEELTPDEKIEEIFNEHQDMLTQDLLNYLTTIKPSDFERVVIDTLLLLGYGRNFEELAKKLGQPNDQGIDGEIPLDKLGLEKIYLQAKRYSKDHLVTASDIRGFIGALSIRGNARKGVFITTSEFTKEAIETVKKDTNHSIILIDGLELVKLMIEYNVGVREIKEYRIKELDKEYFESL